MKKIILSILSIIMIFSFVACPEDVTPTTTTTTVKSIPGVSEDIFFRDSRELIGYSDATFNQITDTAYWGYNDKFINYLVYDYSEVGVNKMTYHIYSDITDDSTKKIGTKVVSTTTSINNTQTVVKEEETIDGTKTTKFTVVEKDGNGNMTNFMVINDDSGKTVEFYEHYEYDGSNRQTISKFYFAPNLTWNTSPSGLYVISAKDGTEMLVSVKTETKYDASNHYDEEIVTRNNYSLDTKKQIVLVNKNYTIHKYLWDSKFTSELPITEIVFDATPDTTNPGEYIYLSKSHQIQINVKTYKLGQPSPIEQPCIVSRSWTNSDGKTFMLDTYNYTNYDSSDFPGLSDVYYMSEETRRIVGVASEYPSYTSYKNTYDVYKKNGKYYVDNQKYTGYQSSSRSGSCETSKTYTPKGGFYAR